MSATKHNLKQSAPRCSAATVCYYSHSEECPDIVNGCIKSQLSENYDLSQNNSKQLSKDIVELFESLRKEMLASLELDRKHISHNVCKGDASETKWREFLQTYLPPRYKVNRGIVINSKGEVSDQIDIVIYDAFNAPFAFKHNDFLYIPIECVCAVFEVKQSMDAKAITYTKKKIESVRKLVSDNGKDNANIIIGGFLSLEYDMAKDSKGTQNLSLIDNYIKTNTPLQCIDCGCCLQNFSFADYNGHSRSLTSEDKEKDNSIIGVKYVTGNKILIAFLLRLILLLEEKRNQRETTTMEHIEQYINQFDIKLNNGTRALF